MSSTDVGRTLVIMLCINSLFFMAQLGMQEVNPNAPTLLNLGTSPIETQVERSGYTMSYNNTQDVIPQGINTENPSFGFALTDPFMVLRDWFGLRYFFMFISAIPSFLYGIGIPTAVAFMLSSVYWLYAVFLGVSWMLGRQN